MLRFMTLLLAASTFGNGATVEDFNDYVDKALRLFLPLHITLAHLPETEARIPSHTFELSGEFILQDMEVKLTEGAVKGLDVVTKRMESCRNPSEVMTDTVTSCTLDLSKLEVTYTAQTKRALAFGNPKIFSVHVRVTSAMASIGLSSSGRRHAKLESFHLNPFTLQISYDRDLNLELSQEIKFVHEVNEYTRSELTKIIEGSYLRALLASFDNACFACKLSS